MSATLLAHRRAVKVSKDQLATLEPPEATKTWTPVKHSCLVDTLTKVVGDYGMRVWREEYAVQREGNILFGVMDLHWQDTQDFSAALGLRTSNDKTWSIQVAIGARVVVCDNLVFSGDLIALRRKHTGNLVLEEEIAGAIRRYQDGYQTLTRGIEKLKTRCITLTEARELIFNVFARRLVPVRLFPRVAQEYVKDAAGCRSITVWDLHNAFTTQMKTLSQGVAFEANTRLGQFFELNALSV